MSDLFRKLNTLVRSRVNDVLSDPPGLDRLRPGRMSQTVEKDIEALRERINEAIDYEDELQARVNALASEVATLDQQADAAVEAGNEEQARHLIAQVQRATQRLQMAQSDLDAHRLVAQELIQKVNLLEAAAADTRRSENEADGTAGSEEPAGNVAESAVDRLGTVMNEAKERITGLSEKIKAQQDIARSDTLADVENTVEDSAVDDDLSARRNRLSKR